MAFDWRSLFGGGPRYVTIASTQQSGGGGVAGPDTKSVDVECMQHKWELIDVVLEGHDAIKRCGKRFLPRFEREPDEKYKRRLHDAPWRPIMNDALENITSRPFTSPVTLAGNPDPRMVEFAEDVDGQGNSLNVFARNTFDQAVSKGVTVFYVDYSRNVPRADGRAKSLTEERDQGIRPFWVHIPVCELIDVRTAFVRGREIVTHARWWEHPKVADGFSETCIPQIRVVEIKDDGRVWWTVWQQQGGGDFAQADSGILSAMDEVPIVRVFTGKKKGVIENQPWSYDLCHVALEYYRSLARQTEIENMSGWPMLAGQGILKPTDGDEVVIGPHTVLFAPPIDGSSSKWELIGPDAALVEQIGKGPERVLDAFSKLAKEPTIPKAGVTATASGMDNSRAHSAIEAWAGNLKNGLDEGLAFTAKWLGIADNVTASVSTDFAALTGSADEAKIIGDAQKRKVVSAKTERAELKRRGILGPDFKEEDEEVRLAEEQSNDTLTPEAQMDPVTGDVIPFQRAAEGVI
ncbi:DUF4055 domain-containing protein [Bradyrhizobium sp. Mp64]|uniref:DUF4055 domain-containing protein n=1 Tax=Bradyrhizobium sp. Mp64 TaxID=3042158 RepID=UPI00248CA906|nr:DUF4055 domain-containing protein [Bradyrhizobium sp. Mp64]MDI2103937.1 DUF4055 domain-containing protein [Bradyrhizobium sp. Mp64]